jgi:two-component sensor histidine kinase
MSVSVRNDQGELVLTFATVQDITKRKRTEQALLDSEAKFRHFFAANSVAHQMVTFMGTSKQTVHIETNNTFEILFADSALAELEPLMSLVDYRALGRAANHPDNPHDFMPPRAAPNSTHTRHNEKRYFNRDGSVFWCDVSKVSFYDAQGLPEVCLSSYQDVTDRKHAQAALEKALADKEMLLKEVHHRTKNNMQLISSMLSIQSRRIGDEMAQQALVESSKRINLLASIHRALYQMPESGDIDAGEQLHYVLEGLTKGLRDTPITINSDIAHVTLDVHQAIPLMLVANELLTNAFKHAFVTPQAGDELTVRLLLEDNNVIFELIDNGVGVPVGAADKDSLGMVIIATLTNQLNADLTLENQPTGGTVARVTFTKHMPLV